MSGVYIPNMEMPKDGSFEVLVVHDNGIVAKGFFPNENELTNAIFIPDHGRLIDADAIPWIETKTIEDNIPVSILIKEQLESVPTIIPTDKEET